MYKYIFSPINNSFPVALARLLSYARLSSNFLFFSLFLLLLLLFSSLSLFLFFFKYIHTRWLKNRPVQCKKGTWSNRETLNAMFLSRAEEINSFEIQPASFSICIRFYIYIYIYKYSASFTLTSFSYTRLSNVSEHKIDDWSLLECTGGMFVGNNR